MHWLAQGLRKVTFRQSGVLMRAQNLKESSFQFCVKKEKKSLPLAAYFLHLGTPSLPACYPPNSKYIC